VKEEGYKRIEDEMINDMHEIDDMTSFGAMIFKRT